MIGTEEESVSKVTMSLVTRWYQVWPDNTRCDQIETCVTRWSKVSQMKLLAGSSAGEGSELLLCVVALGVDLLHHGEVQVLHAVQELRISHRCLRMSVMYVFSVL